MGRKKIDFEGIERVCTETSERLEGIEQLVLPWAIDREKLAAPLENLLRRRQEIAERFPEQWLKVTVGQVAVGQVFAFPARTRRFLRTHGGDLAAEESELVGRFERVPWFYCLFLVRGKRSRDLFTIENLDGGQERLLYSPAVTDLTRTGARLFLCLVFDNGTCLQTYGVVRFYRGFQPFDFHYFARLLLPGTYRSEGLSATIAASPGSFFLLDMAAEIPAIAHRGEPMEVCDQEVRRADFDPAKITGEFERATAEDIQRLAFKGEDTPFPQAYLFHDPKKKRLLAHATSMRLYARLREALAAEVSLPEEPEWHAGMSMVITARQILGKEPPSMAYISLFEPEGEPEEPVPLKALLAELADAHNQGTAYSLDELAKRHGISPDVARQLEGIVREPAPGTAGGAPPVEGGLAGYRPPPPAVRQGFIESPWKNDVFLFLDSPRVRALYGALTPVLEQFYAERRALGHEGFPPPPDLEGLPDWLEDLYDDLAEQPDFTLLNASLHLLCSRGEAFEPVRDYAAEILRLFGQVFIPGGEPERVGRFCLNVLCAGGLAEAEPGLTAEAGRRADFRLRPTPFLHAWASPHGRP